MGDNFLAITKKCFEVGGYVQRWEDAAGGYRKKVFWGVVHWVPQPAFPRGEGGVWGRLVFVAPNLSVIRLFEEM